MIFLVAIMRTTKAKIIAISMPWTAELAKADSEGIQTHALLDWLMELQLAGELALWVATNSFHLSRSMIFFSAGSLKPASVLA